MPLFLLYVEGEFRDVHVDNCGRIKIHFSYVWKSCGALSISQGHKPPSDMENMQKFHEFQNHNFLEGRILALISFFPGGLHTKLLVQAEKSL